MGEQKILIVVGREGSLLVVADSEGREEDHPAVGMALQRELILRLLLPLTGIYSRWLLYMAAYAPFSPAKSQTQDVMVKVTDQETKGCSTRARPLFRSEIGTRFRMFQTMSTGA